MAFQTLVSNLRAAASMLRRTLGSQYYIVLEPVSDVPRYYLDSLHKTLNVMAHVGADNLGLVFDCYHVQRLHGNVGDVLESVLPYVRHIQVASVPRRREPDRGELNYMYLFKRLDKLRYGGWVGLEYAPTQGKTRAGLRPWFPSYQRKRHGSAGILFVSSGKNGKPYLLLGQSHKSGHAYGLFWGRPDKADKDQEWTAVREASEETLGVIATPNLLYSALKNEGYVAIYNIYGIRLLIC